MTDNDTMKLVKDLMSKAERDSQASMERNISLLLATAGKDHIFNVIRAGFTPYLQVLLELFPPEMVAAHVTYMILQLKHIEGGGRAVPNFEDAKRMSDIFVGVLKPVMDNIGENFPHYKPDEKEYRDRD